MKEMKYTHAHALINKISTWTTEIKNWATKNMKAWKVEAAQIRGTEAM
ncbi:hypothetical protein [Thiolapillus sp.]